MPNTPALVPDELAIYQKDPRQAPRIVRVKAIGPDYVSIWPTDSIVSIRVRPETLQPIANTDMIQAPSLGARTGKPRLPKAMSNGLPNRTIGEFVFAMTCEACPEQYDVFNHDGTRQVAYVRLRWGGLSCRVPDHNGETVYSADLGDSGTFADDDERDRYLNAAAYAIHCYYESQPGDP